MIKKLVCQKCGVVNDINTADLADGDENVPCTLPEHFEWVLPAGKITPVVGEPVYVSALGEHLSRKAYIDKYNIDPEISCKMMRGGIRDHMRIGRDLGVKSPKGILGPVKRLISR